MSDKRSGDTLRAALVEAGCGSTQVREVSDEALADAAQAVLDASPVVRAARGFVRKQSGGTLRDAHTELTLLREAVSAEGGEDE